jgi:peptide/nickel transport system substrate-binding protein
MKKIFVIPLGLILIIGLILNGCASSFSAPAQSSASATSSKSDTLAPQNGGVLKIINTGGTMKSIGLPGGVDLPSDGTIGKVCVESLIALDPKGNDQPVPSLATSWQVSPDRLNITLNLRKGVKFQDGTDFNAEAAKYCLELIRSSARAELKLVKSIDIVDDYTIKLNFSSYDPYIFTSLAGVGGMMASPTALKAMGNNAMTHPVGTGPFKFVSYKTDSSIKFEKFDGYWQKGKPYLDGIEFNFIADPVTSLASFKVGEAQAISGLAAKDVSDLKATGKYNVTLSPAYVAALAGDSAHSSSPYADIRVRRAIAYAIDNQTIAKTLGFGLIPYTNQLRPPDGVGYNSAVVGYPFNVSKAKQLLAEAGYSNGFQTKITFTSNPSNLDLFTAIQSYLQEVGIKLTLDPADAARSTQVATGGWNNQMVAMSPPASKGMDPGRSLEGYISPIANRLDPKSFYRPPEYDTKFNQIRSELDPQKRLVMIQEIQKMIIDDYCLAMPIFIGESLFVQDSRVHDMDMFKYAVYDWRAENVWLSK